MLKTSELTRKIETVLKKWRILHPIFSTSFEGTVRYNFIIDRVKNSQEVCDVGCGDGFIGKLLKVRYGTTVINLDIEPVASCDLIIRADGASLPFRGSVFDFVVSSDVLEHLPPNKRIDYLKEMLRVSRRGIVFSFSTQHPKSYGASFFENWFKYFRMDLPRWYIEHGLYPVPNVHKILNILTRLHLKVNVHHYKGILSLTLFGLLLVSMGIKRFKLLKHIICGVINIISYLLLKFFDFPPWYGHCIEVVKQNSQI